MKKHATLIAAIGLLAVVGCANQSGDVTGGTVELIPKSGILASKGLRVRGNDVKPVNGRTKHTLETGRLSLSGSDWPYLVEIRFKDSESGQPLRLSPRQRHQTLVNLRVHDAGGDAQLSGSVFDKWLSPSGADAYYYLNPSIKGYPRAFHVSDQKGIELEAEISMEGAWANRVTCSVSIRTGGTK